MVPVQESEESVESEESTESTETGEVDRSGEPHPVDGLVFEVILGVYQDQVPGQDAAVIASNSDKGIEREQDEDFNTIFKCGNFSNFEEAEALKDDFVGQGLDQARVQAQFNGEVIDLERAVDMTYE